MRRPKYVDVLDQYFNLYVLLNQTSDVLFKVRRKELEAVDLSPWHATILFSIRVIGKESTPAQISRLTLRESQTISEILNTMETQGLITRTQDLDKKNLVRVVLTKKGRKKYRQSVNRESLHEIISSLSEEQQKQLWSCLHILRDKALEKLGMNYEMLFPPQSWHVNSKQKKKTD